MQMYTLWRLMLNHPRSEKCTSFLGNIIQQMQFWNLLFGMSLEPEFKSKEYTHSSVSCTIGAAVTPPPRGSCWHISQWRISGVLLDKNASGCNINTGLAKNELKLPQAWAWNEVKAMWRKIKVKVSPTQSC